ncbi:hypothetical protein FJR38_03850 [Anabaena sp. UHCC 0253]|uniref:FG-GAP-like repeat-containing protein n=1 Tax=Anabaena sp. UHCC 0253 TaxID=2590019 RepID=UPI0014457597|nr:FG-GAP-like repeat-containing protein [Anabaena sp. UHCC 0253]MTJ51867.1 hypothetical protein [Anabaena sp. UHCC 0253]
MRKSCVTSSLFTSIEGVVGTNYDDTLNLSSLTITNSDNLVTGLVSIKGNNGNDTITGSQYSDLLDGGAGSDNMIGGLGNDIYIVDNTSDVVTETSGQGNDTIKSSVTFSLPNNVENLTLTGTEAINGIGNSGNNIIIGNSGNDILSGDTVNNILIGDTANATFGEPIRAVINYSPNQGWSSFDEYPRHVADVNGDGRADIVGFKDRVYVALGQADGTFGSVNSVSELYTQGWSSFDKYPRQLADVNGDGRADIVGFGGGAVYVSLGQTDGFFGEPILAVSNYSPNQGWSSFKEYPRHVADVNGDGRADIVGFKDRVYVALGQADGTFGSVNSVSELYTQLEFRLKTEI